MNKRGARAGSRSRAAAKSQMAEEVLAAIVEGGPGAYVLLGDNGLDHETVTAAVVDKLTDETTRTFNSDVFHADDRECSADDIASAVRSYPTFASARVVVVRGLEDAQESVGSTLADLAARPLGDTVLVMTAAKLDGRKKWCGQVSGQSRTFTLAAPKGRQFPPWLKRRAKRFGATISDDAASTLVDLIGTDVYRAASEVEKLANYVLPRTTIDVADVEEAVGMTRDDTVYSLTDRIAEADARGALEIAHRMVQADQHPAYLVGMIVRHWERLRLAADVLGRGREQDLGAFLGESRPFIVSKLAAQARALRRNRIRTGFRLALSAESAIKGGWSAPQVALDGLVCQLAKRRAP